MIDKQTNNGKGFKLGSRRYMTIDGFMQALKNESKDETVAVDPDDFQDGLVVECPPDCVPLGDGSCSCSDANKDDEIIRADEDDVVAAFRQVVARHRAPFWR